jgi:hypothetical protein
VAADAFAVMGDALAAEAMRGRELFHFKYHFNAAPTHKMAIPSIINQPVAR